MKLRENFAVTAVPLLVAALLVLFVVESARAASVTIVAIGASNTYGKGVARNQAYPAQLEAMLRAKGLNARVVNVGVNGETTGTMLRQLDGTVPSGVTIVILQPGGNDARKGEIADRARNISTIQSRLAARGIKVIMIENGALHGLPHQADGQHLTPDGYHMLAAAVLSQVESSIRQ